MIVKELFAIKDRQKLMVHLSSFEWDFTKFGSVNLQIGNHEIHCRYTACGNQKDIAVVELVIDDNRYDDVKQIERLFSELDGDAYLVRFVEIGSRGSC